MDNEIKPIYLLADSRALFLKENDKPVMSALWNYITGPKPTAAYIGASNGDNPAYYSIFEAAMESIGVLECRMILSSFSESERSFLANADIVLLAGGSTSRGWQIFEQSGLKQAILDRYHAGAILMGVSAGAVQLGLVGWDDEDSEAETFFYTFGLVPFIISVHDEANSWDRLKRAVSFIGDNISGIGIQSGGAMLYHPDHTLEPVKHSVEELSIRDGRRQSNILLPPSPAPVAD